MDQRGRLVECGGECDFVASPSVPIQPGAIANQSKGEPKWNAIGGTWFLSYDDRIINGKSVPAMQTSGDRGITWQDIGPLVFSPPLSFGGGLAITAFFLDPVSNNWSIQAALRFWRVAGRRRMATPCAAPYLPEYCGNHGAVFLDQHDRAESWLLVRSGFGFGQLLLGWNALLALFGRLHSVSV